MPERTRYLSIASYKELSVGDILVDTVNNYEVLAAHEIGDGQDLVALTLRVVNPEGVAYGASFPTIVNKHAKCRAYM